MKNKKDNIEKEYFKDDEIFSNIFNYYLFKGENIISSKSLKELDIEYNNENINRKRDIFKLAEMKTDDKYKYLLLGIENQTKIDKYMALRCMLYDSLEYDKQRNIDNYFKNDKMKLKREIYPVITIVIYFSSKPWTGPRDLYSILGIKEEPIMNYVSNYKLNIIEPYRMEEKDFKLLNNDLSLLFEFVKNSGDEDKLEKLIRTKDRFTRINKKTIRLINEITNSKIEIDEEAEEINMCKAIDDMRRHAKEEGRVEGIAKGRAEGRAEGKEAALADNIKTMHSNGFDVNTIARALSLDINFVKKVLA